MAHATAIDPGNSDPPIAAAAHSKLTDFVSQIIQRMLGITGVCAAVMREFRPNEANAIDYRRKQGHYLGFHCDDRHLSGTILCNLCLAGDATMVYTKDAKLTSRKSSKRSDTLAKEYEVRLHRRALQIQSGTVRYEYQHGIPNKNLLDDRRMSITFRQNKYKGHNV